MEQVANFLRPYKNEIATVATLASILQYCAGICICLNIHRKQSTEDVSSITFIGSLVLALLGLKYAVLLQDSTLFNVNIICIILNTIYIIIFHHYSNTKWEDVYRPLLHGVILIACMYAYAAVEVENKVAFRFGLLLTSLLLIVLAYPLKELKTIYQTKDASCLPFPITMMACIGSIVWGCYGLVTDNHFMVMQNIVSLTICFAQIVLYFKYPGGLYEACE